MIEMQSVLSTTREGGGKMKIEKVGVLGCGLMGSGIAQVTAQGGYKVVVREIDQKFIDKGFGFIEKNLSRAVEKGKLSSEEKDKTAANLTGTLSSTSCWFHICSMRSGP